MSPRKSEKQKEWYFSKDYRNEKESIYIKK